MPDSNEDFSLLKGAASLGKAAAYAGTGSYAKAGAEFLSGFRNIIYLSVCIISVAAVFITSLPQAVLATSDALTDPDSFADVYSRIYRKVNGYFSRSYETVYETAYESAEEYASSFDSNTYRISVKVTGPFENASAEISDEEVCALLAAYSVVSQYDYESEYSDITETLYSEVASLESGILSDRKVLNTIKEYCRGCFSAGEPVYAEQKIYTEKTPVTDSSGNQIADIRTGEPVYTEKEIHEGTVSVKISMDEDGYLKDEIRQAQSGTDNDIQEEISFMTECLLWTVSVCRGDESSVSIISGRASSSSAAILNFISSENYDRWSGHTAVLSRPYSSDCITSGYGYRDLDGWHDGIDYSWDGCRLADIPCAGDGIVVYAYGDCTADRNPSYGYGNLVIVYHGKLDGKDIFTLYGHCEKVYVRTGDAVTAGQTIRGIGQRGNSTGYHLHFEVNAAENGAVKRVNPEVYIKK